MLNKILYNLSITKRYSTFLDILGYLSFSKSSQSLEALSFKDFNKSVNYLAKQEKEYQSFGVNLPREEILYLLSKARIAYLGNDFELTELYLKKAGAQTFNLENIEGSILKDIYIFSVDLLKVQLAVAQYVEKIEREVADKYTKIDNNVLKIKDIVASYENQELNSEQHLLASKDHLELVVNNVALETKIEDYLEGEIKNEGQALQYKIDFLLNKMFTNHLLIKNNSGLVLSGNRSVISLFIYLFLSIEKLKLNYYLRTSENNLTKIVEIISLLVRLNHDDPLGFILGEVVPIEIYETSPLSKANLFNDYVKSFQLKLYKASKQLKYFDLTLYAKEKYKTKEERVKLFHVTEKEILEMEKQRVSK